MPLFLDACALAKPYLDEGRSTSRMRRVVGRPKRWGGLFVSSLTEIEVVSAIAKAAREYGNPFERPHALERVPQTVDSFLKDYRSGAFDVVEQAEDVVRAGIGQLRGKPQHSIGAADAIHLASALKLVGDQSRPLVFVTADRGLYDAAREHGLAVYNPNVEHEERLETLAGL